MRPQPQARRRWVYGVVFWLAFAVGLGVLRSRLAPAPDAWMLDLTNNPDKFFLWGATTNFHYTFTYDPHAADQWRFEWGSSSPAPHQRTNQSSKPK